MESGPQPNQFPDLDKTGTYLKGDNYMMTTNQSAIIRTKNIDNGYTCGKNVYQTADGKWWEESRYIDPDNLGTGESIAHKTGNIIWW
jgi:hypothetical protein